MPPAARTASARTGATVSLDEQQPLPHPFVVDAVVEAARVGPLVHVAEAGIAVGPVLDDEHRHRGGVDAGERADRAIVVAAVDRDLAPRELSRRVLRVGGETLEQDAADHRVALPAGIVLPGHRRARGEDGIGRHSGQRVDRRPDVGQHRLGFVQSRESERVRFGSVHAFHPVSGRRAVAIKMDWG